MDNWRCVPVDKRMEGVMKYKKLKKGVTLIKGDEFQDRDKWLPTQMPGAKVGDVLTGNLKYRRPIKEER